jgi:curved DNA-binding protein CbpA
MSAPDYYRILQVEPGAPAPLIHASYRTLLRRALGSRGSADIAALDAAYAVLGDSQRRAAYDRERAARTDAPHGAHNAAGVTTAQCLFCGEASRFDGALEPDDECATCASPLYPAERQRLKLSGQRTLRRLPKRHPVSVWVTWPQSAAILGDMRNLSLDGMAFESNVLFKIHQIVRIDCTELHALGRIAHAAPTKRGVYRFGAGIEFLTLRFRRGGGSFASPDE